MTKSPARRSILAFGVLTALSFLYPTLSDEFAYADKQQALFGVAVYALILWRLWHGSPAAWVIVLSLTLFGLFVFVASSPRLEFVWVVFLASVVAQLMILLSRPVRAHVWSRSRPRAVVG